MDILTPWKLAMFAVLALLMLQRVYGPWPKNKVRTWLALMGASLASYFVVPSEGAVPLLAFIAIDAIAASAILMRPAGIAQKSIGLLFTIMIMYHAGFALAEITSSHYINLDTTLYWKFMHAAGWAQLVILALWGGTDVGKSILYRFRFRRNTHAIKDAGGGI